jgi:hypothetical protein
MLWKTNDLACSPTTVLVADTEGDDLRDEEHRALHEALSTSSKSAEAARLRPPSKFWTS